MSRDGWRGFGALVRLASARPVVTVLLSVVFAIAALAYTFGLSIRPRFVSPTCRASSGGSSSG